MAVLIILSIGVVEDKSAVHSLNIPPIASIFALVSAQLLLATPKTLAPALAYATHIACPRPVLAPVTIATLSLISNIIFYLTNL